jgi:two-component system, LytTR family, sensor histidine kinase AlgZ
MGSTTRQPESSAREFFIPDLCATKPVMILFILAELLVVVYVLGDSPLPEFSWNVLALASLFVQWIVLLSAGCLCALRGVLGRLSVPLGVALSFVTILLVTAVSSQVARSGFDSSVYRELDDWWLLRNILVAAVIGGIALRYFYLQQQLRQREQAELNARLESLRARIRPHFLFNTMNSIASLISIRPAEAEQAVEDLAELFRASLTDDDTGKTLEDELHVCRLYLRIEQLRLGERLSVDWQVDESLITQSMPSLILQPLIENAVYHGVAQLPDGGVIRISISSEDGYLLAEIENPLPTDGSARAGSGMHMALENIHQRLQALFGEQGKCSAGQDGSIFRVNLSYPLAGGL